MQNNMSQPVSDSDSLLSLKGVGPKVAEKLQKLDIYTQEDLLFHLPLRYQDRSHIYPLGSLRAGKEYQVLAEVQLTEIKYARKRMLLSRIADGTGFITLRFFHFSAAQKEHLKRGARLLCYGEVRKGNAGLEMIHPEYQLLSADEEVELNKNLSPIYPVTDGVHQLTLRNLIAQVLLKVQTKALAVPDLLPAGFIKNKKLPAIVKTIEYLHHPPVNAPLHELAEVRHASQKRLIIEELLAHHLSLRQLRFEMQKEQAYSLAEKGGLTATFIEQLPFALTSAQDKVLQHINRDMSRSLPTILNPH